MEVWKWKRERKTPEKTTTQKRELNEICKNAKHQSHLLYYLQSEAYTSFSAEEF